MNIKVPEINFNEVKNSLFKIDIDNSTIDTHIKPILKRLKVSPIIDEICPRWSCEGHSEKYRDCDYEIIFCAIGDDSFDILYDMFNKLSEEYQKLTNECVSVSLNIVNLIYSSHSFDVFYPHVKLSITTLGDTKCLNNSVTSWNNTLDYIETKYNKV